MKRRREEPFTGFIWLIELAALGLSQIVTVGWRTYNELPQAFGGGKPTEIQLYVNREAVPDDLLESSSKVKQPSVAQTVLLTLILQTSSEFIVYPSEGDGDMVWIVKSDSVLAVKTKSVPP